MTSCAPRFHSSWRVLLLLLGLLILLAVPIPAAAHAQLVSATPAAGQRLTVGPTTIRLTFSEQVALDFSSIQVLDRGRHRLDSGPVTQPTSDRLSLQVGVQPNLPSGVYTVIWRVVSATDGHLTESNYAFVVLLPGEPTPTPGAEPTPAVISPGDTTGPSSPEGSTPPPSPIRWLLRALALLLAAWLLGGPLFTVLVLEPALLANGAPAEGQRLLTVLQRRWGRLGVGAAILLLFCLGADMLFQVADLVGVTPLEAFGRLDVLGRFLGGTSYGLYWALRVGAVIVLGLLCLGLARAVQADVTLWSIGVAAAGLIFAGEALSSHPAAAAPVLGLPLGTLADLVHLMATGAWVGGLLYFAVVLLPLLHSGPLSAATRGQMLARIVPRFSTIATISVGLLIVTGFINLALRTLDPVAIVASNYGQVLILKHLLFLPLLGLGLVQNRVIQPRLIALLAGDRGTGPATVSLFQRVIRGEVLLASAVLLCAGGLTLLPPPVAGAAPAVTPGPTPLVGTPLPTAVPGTPTPSPTPVVVTGTQTLGGLDVGLTVRPDLAGDQFIVRLDAVDASPLITGDLRLQLRITPQDVNAGSTLLPLTFAGADGPAQTYTATDSILTLAGGYDARVLVSRRSGNDVKIAYRLTLDENGGLTIAPAPFIQVQVSTNPSPAISGTVQLDLRLTDGVGQPVEGATVNLLPLMPAHAHIEPQDQAQAVPGTPGLYRATVNLQMGGGWLIIVDVNQPGQPPIRTDASFDVIDPNATPTPATDATATPSAP